MAEKDEKSTRSLRETWASLKARQLQVYFHIFVIHIYNNMRDTYKQRYGAETAEASEAETDPANETGQSSRRDTHKKSRDLRWRWESLPRMWPFLTWYHCASTFWMMYVIIKYAILERALDQLNLTSKPARCYVLGRFIFVEGVERVSAILFASYNLTWRYIQYMRFHPINISTMYFLILDDRDIAQFNKLSATARRATQQGNEQARLGVDRLMYEIMSYPVESAAAAPAGTDKTLNRLKPNRTLEAHRNLTNYMITANWIGILIFVPMVLVVGTVLMLLGFNDERYLRDYSTCSPDLERMRARGELTKWSVHFGAHQILAFTAGTIENTILWFQGGINFVFPPLMALVINRDLLLYWEHLNAKIDACLAAVRERLERQGGWMQHKKLRDSQALTVDCAIESASLATMCMSPHHVQSSSSCSQQAAYLFDKDDILDEQLQDIQFEFQDLIRSIKQADHLIGDSFSVLLTVWFSLLAFFTYKQQTDLLPALKATLIFVGFILTALYLGMLQLHRSCLKAYPNICSLMALTHSRYTRNFTYVMDYYVKKQTCYTFCGRVPMTGVQYLTGVGWSLSCLFLVLGKRF